MIQLQDFRAARRLIAPHMRVTPVFAIGTPDFGAAVAHAANTPDLFLKLENLQVSGSFKARGAMNAALNLDETTRSKGLVTASGGNHGMGVINAARVLNVPVKIFLPTNTPKPKVAKLRKSGVDVTLSGSVWDEANHAAITHARDTGMAYIHPFADPNVIAGQGTIALEMLEQQADLDTLVVAVGGGGLISGVATAARLVRPGIRIIGVEPTGAPTLFESLKHKEVVTLPAVNTAATSLAPRQSSALNVDLIGQNVDRIVLVSDDEMRNAAGWMWRELGLSVELSAAAGIAAVMQDRLGEGDMGKTGIIVCGTGTDGQ
ncbi:threonine dehydratase [Thalassospira profundimaris]|uniref:Threonine dehydratase n=1 Tax=Thalassospira profundimaris TaxID=502049 RepID=A0A367X597_9PROT|nr:threonine/serine dehydratase [Thalassospira profundimaris]RCK48757.1 threonine dehydratase [Thalassospira profundimaris]